MLSESILDRVYHFLELRIIYCQDFHQFVFIFVEENILFDMIIIVFSFDVSFELFHFDLCEAT
jgi:hypothetical protein